MTTLVVRVMPECKAALTVAEPASIKLKRDFGHEVALGGRLIPY